MFYLNISWFIQFSSFFSFSFSLFIFHLIYSPIKNYFQFKGNVCEWMPHGWVDGLDGLDGCMADGWWDVHICRFIHMRISNENGKYTKMKWKKKWRKIENKRKTEKCWIFLCCRHCWCLTCKIIFIRYTSTYSYVIHFHTISCLYIMHGKLEKNIILLIPMNRWIHIRAGGLGEKRRDDNRICFQWNCVVYRMIVIMMSSLKTIICRVYISPYSVHLHIVVGRGYVLFDIVIECSLCSN